MPKEVTLNDLAASAKPVEKTIDNSVPTTPAVQNNSQSVEAPKEAPQVKQQQSQDNKSKANNIGPKMGSGDVKHGAKLSTAQVTDAMIKSGQMKAKEDDTENAPIVENAVNSMVETINRKKIGIAQMINTMESNLEEVKLENELDSGNIDGEDNTQSQQQYNQSNNDSSLDDDLEAELEAEVDNKPVKNDKANRQAQTHTNNQKNISQYNIDTLDDDLENEEDDDRFEERISANRKTTSSTNNIPRQELTPVTDQDKENEELDTLLKELDNDQEIVDTEEETQEEMIAKFKKSFQNIKINQDQIDFTKFSIDSKPINSSFILNNIQSDNHFKKADWALYQTKRSVTFRECDGPELDALRRTMENTNNVNRVIASLQFIYNHVVDANKPPFESWCKLIRTEDIDSMYYGIYKACYADSNLVARTCNADGCKKTSLIETDINDMVVYGRETDDHEKVKAEFEKILNNDTTTEKNAFKSTLLQISNDLVVAYSPATLYSTFIMYATLRDDITNRYSDTLNTMSYIDNFFYIDRNNNKLIPIEIKQYPGNINKSALNKLKVYREILKSLTNDQFNVFMGKLNGLVQMPVITYKMPSCKCPECDAEMPETPIDSMLNLLFTRAQLARIRSL